MEGGGIAAGGVVETILTKHAAKVVMFFIIITAFFSFFLSRVQVDNSTASFIPDTHPEVLALQELEQSFNLGEAMLLGIRSPFLSILQLDYLDIITELSREIEQIPKVDSTLSLVNFENVTAASGLVVSKPILEGFDGSPKAVETLLYNLSDWEITRNLLISADGRSLQMIINMQPDLKSKDYEQIYTTITRILEQEQYLESGLEYVIAGIPAVDVLISQNMFADASLLTPLAFITTMLILLFFFKRIGGMLLPLLTVIISIIWTVGLLAALSISISLVAAVMPVLLVAVGSAYGIHYTHRYYHQHLEQGYSAGDSVIKAYKAVWLPILMAGLTTVAGFASLAFTDIEPIRHFAIFTAIGVLFAVLISLSLVPALLFLSSGRHRERSAAPKKMRMNPYLYTAYQYAVQRHGLILFCSLLLALLSVYAIPRIVIDNNVIKYFNKDSYVAKADRFFLEHFFGTRIFHIMFTGEETGSMTDIDILLTMDACKQYLQEKYPQISIIHSYTDYIKRMNQLFQRSRVGGSAPVSAEAAEQGREKYEDLDIPDFGGEDIASLLAELGDDFIFEDSFNAETTLPASNEANTAFGNSRNNESQYLLQGNDTAPPGSSQSIDAEVLMHGFLNTASSFRERELTASDFVYDLRRLVNYEEAAYYTIPSDPEEYNMADRQEMRSLISQYLFLYGNNLSSWVDNPLVPRAARMQVYLKDSGTRILASLQNDIDFFSKMLPPSYEVRMTGTTIVENSLNQLVVRTQISSLVMAIIIVFIILVITFRSFLVGIAGLLPIIISVLVSFSAMGIIPVTLNISTAMVASIVIGIGIDYAIHYLHAYKRECMLNPKAGFQYWEMQVFEDVGGAISFNAVSVALGFGVLLFSLFSPLRNLGLLIVLTMMFSAFTALLLLPLLLRVIRPFTPEKRKSPIRKAEKRS